MATTATTVGNSPHRIGTAMTKLATSAAPSWAIRIWVDGLTLYAEVPGNPPYIHRESLTEGGLWKMINYLKARSSEADLASYRVPEQLFTTKVGKEQFKTSNEQRTAALDVLRKMGMV